MSLRKKVFLAVLTLGVLFRISLPFGLRSHINHQLAEEMKAYSGRVEGLSLSFYKGSYSLRGLRIWKRDRGEFAPLLYIENLEISLLSHVLRERGLMASLDVYQPVLRLVDSVTPDRRQLGEEQDWSTLVSKLIPLKIETLRVHDGLVIFQNLDYKKPVQIHVDKISLSAINIYNTEHVLKGDPGQVNFSARVQHGAWLRGRGRFDFLATQPSFAGQANLGNLRLARMNNVFILYGPYYFRTGEMSLYSQIVVRRGAVRGYLTPSLKNIEAAKIVWNNRSPQNFLGESVKALGSLVLNAPIRKVESRRYAFTGQMTSSEEPWTVFWSTLRSGFNKNKKEKKKPLALRKKSVVAEQKEP